MNIYPTKIVYQIGRGNSQFCDFDFSIIPNDQYEKLFNSFPNFLYKKVEAVSFNCNFEYEYQQLGRKSTKRENLISDSIANNKPKFIPYLVKILKIVLPKTKSLHSIEFASMKISRSIMPKLLNILATNRQIDTIIFRNVPTSDDHFIRFLGSATPYVLKKVAFNGCGLTSVSFPAIKTFLKQRAPKGLTTRQLQEFDLSGNSLTTAEFDDIEDLVQANGDLQKQSEAAGQNSAQSSPKPGQQKQQQQENGSDSDSYYDEEDETIDNMTIQTTEVRQDNPPQSQSSNKQAPMQRSYSPRKLLYSSSSSDDDGPRNDENDKQYSYSLSESDNDQRPPVAQPQKREASLDDEPLKSRRSSDEEEEDMQTVSSVESDVPSDEEEIRDQNERLRKELRYILWKNKGTMYQDDVFVLGNGAKELVEVVTQMKNRINDYQQLNEEIAAKKKKNL